MAEFLLPDSRRGRRLLDPGVEIHLSQRCGAAPHLELLAGASKETLMVKLGHADFRTTQRYVNLAGVVFADEAAALERRMNGSAVESSTDLSEPESTSAQPASLNEAGFTSAH